ncbi:MAG: hypothetical protein KGQ38_02005 [Actinomycetales bacterium]|nr:hypothetical protein [Actinomycetales bacterium]
MSEIPLPHHTRLSPDRADFAAIIAAHEQAVISGAEGYIDPTNGAYVFTVTALQQRAFCCETGCRHCPFLA